jgi:hypothetical protein
MIDNNMSDEKEQVAETQPRKQHRPLAPRAAEFLTERQGPLPVWVRAPATGHEFFSGFTRSKLYELAGAGHIRSASIREPGQVKGTRLFNLPSILGFIQTMEGTARVRTLPS